ncbi:putative methyltransferase PMT21 [Panicum miliaceum]|uniref:Methyltransferase n=1 Tax=Panicum miliaceum TaxID=4540 RepID=A0A3L6SE32_PANMI|nr:putative methyltransferase PMT21 [Panicum miliaceum]
MKYSKEDKPERAGGAGAGGRAVPVALLVILLCAFSFYLGGVYSTGRSLLDSIQPAPTLLTLGTTAAQQSSALAQPAQSTTTAVAAVSFPECPADFQDYTPCTDPRRWRRYGNYRLSFMERHCPPPPERQQCLVPPPKGYKPPIRWPKSKDQCWYRNVPYDWINSQKSNQHWLAKDGDRFRFPGGGTMFPNGVGAYVDAMRGLIPGMRDGTVRTALDTGCGVASWGGDLLGRGILTVSLAPRDNHEAQVQFALERGIPAILGIISTQRLPFPSAAFDMAHCSRCLIPWTEFGGLYLLEIHRVLRPGGFWVLSGPPINYENRWHGWNTTVQAQKADFDRLKKMLAAMCFKLYNIKGDIAVWQKSPDATACYDKLTPITTPAKCDDSVDPDAAWYVPMRPCVTAPSARYKKLGLNATPKWPQRLTVAPERINVVPGSSAGAFKQDDAKWKLRAKHYKTLLPALGTDKIRNIMDMNTVYGGFAASIIKDPVWVMNVVSSYGPNSLGVVYDRGLIGVNHDWCEAFSTYPRTYDLLHLDGLFTAESHRCEMKFVLLEMDRILRPTGYAIIRESTYFLDSVAAIAKGMRWSCERRNPENKTDKDKILICQKKLWAGKQ